MRRERDGVGSRVTLRAHAATREGTRVGPEQRRRRHEREGAESDGAQGDAPGGADMQAKDQGLREGDASILTAVRRLD